jgi:predicted metal-dependent phosphoesterase TrpH
MAVTDHDTTAAVDEVGSAASAAGVDAIAGIEITAVEDGRDVHVLGYFIDHADRALQEFLARQRAYRLDRVQDIARRLESLGLPIAIEPILIAARAHPSRSVGRPQVARAMIEAGHVTTIDEAFNRWLGRDGPAFIPRIGASPEAVIAIIRASGGMSSVAHPGRTRIDSRLGALRDAGLDALEAFHTDHDEQERARYVHLAGALGLQVTGGSDFHGDPARTIAPGSTTIPHEHWAALSAARAGRA